MSGSDSHAGDRGQRSRIESFPSLSRYDLLLAAIPGLLLAGTLIGRVLGVPTRTALGGAALLGFLALFDALFLDPPTGTGR